MAKKKIQPEQELDRAYEELTGRPIQPRKKAAGFSSFLITICLVAVVLAVCAIGIPFLLDSPQPTDPTVPEPSQTEPTETQPLLESGTVILGLDLSGKTRPEAIRALEDLYRRDMTVTIAGAEYTLPSADAVTAFDAPGAVDALLEDPRQFDAKDWLILDTQAIRDRADQWASQWQRDAVATSWTITGDMPTLEPIGTEPECQTLLLTKGSPSYALDSESLYQAMLQGYQNGEFSVEAEVTEGTLDPFDLTAVFDQYYTVPVDAVMDMDSFHVSGGTYGYEFDLEAAQAQLEAADYGAVIAVPFYRTAPAISAQSLQDLLFRDTLSSFRSAHTDDFNRNTNLKLACQAINGMILYPGQEFSYNQALGQRTTEKGYLPAGSFMGGATVDTVGGGICQVSSSLYYCCLMADLEITCRACHAYTVPYVPMGMDATVSWGSYDYRFRNSTNYPIRIEAWVSDGYVHIQLIGTDEKDYYVEMEYEVAAVYPYETVYRELYADNSDGYRDGDQIVSPYTGYDVYTYRCKYDKATGALISRDYEAFSDYWVRNEVIAKIVG